MQVEREAGNGEAPGKGEEAVTAYQEEETRPS